MISESFKRGKESLFKKLQKGETLTPEIEKEIMDVYEALSLIHI